jgi:hypothetical protein
MQDYAEFVKKPQSSAHFDCDVDVVPMLRVSHKVHLFFKLLHLLPAHILHCTGTNAMKPCGLILA